MKNSEFSYIIIDDPFDPSKYNEKETKKWLDKIIKKRLKYKKEEEKK